MHMKAPQKHETKILDKKYEAYLKAQKEAIKTKYQKTINSLKTNADAVVKEIFEAFKEVKQTAEEQIKGEAGDKQEPAAGAKELLNYLYGVLLNDLSANLLTELAGKNAKEDVERIHAVELPRTGKRIIELQIEDSDKAKCYGYDEGAK